MDIDKEGQIIFEKQQKSRRTVIFGDISIFGKTFFEYFAKNEKLLFTFFPYNCKVGEITAPNFLASLHTAAQRDF